VENYSANITCIPCIARGTHRARQPAVPPARLGGADDLVGLLDLGKSWASRDYITCAHPGQIDSKTSARSSSERSPPSSQLICDRPTAIFIAIPSKSRFPYARLALSARKRSSKRSSGFRKPRRIGDDHRSRIRRFERPFERKVGKFGKAANKGERSQSGGGWNRFSRLPLAMGYAISRRMKTPRSPMILRAFLAFGWRRGAGGGRAGEKERDVERRKIFSRNVLAIGLCLAVPLYSAFNPASDLRGRSSILRVHLPPSRRDATRSGAGPPLRISIASGTLSHIFSSGRAATLEETIISFSVLPIFTYRWWTPRRER